MGWEQATCRARQRFCPKMRGAGESVWATALGRVNREAGAGRMDIGDQNRDAVPGGGWRCHRSWVFHFILLILILCCMCAQACRCVSKCVSPVCVYLCVSYARTCVCCVCVSPVAQHHVCLVKKSALNLTLGSFLKLCQTLVPDRCPLLTPPLVTTDH